jgi:hypothetical protein
MACKVVDALVFVVALGSAGCGAATRYPLRAPLAHDTDERPVNVACELRPTPKDPQHVACAPKPYVSPLAWDGIDNSIFRPLSQTLALDPAGRALNANAFDEVPDSAWFENRIGAHALTREELLRGACMPDDLLDPARTGAGGWLIDAGKDNGASAGFRIRVSEHKYMLKTDIPEQPERPTAASAIGAAIYYAVGFNTSCEQVVYFDAKVLRLAPGLTVTDNSGITKPFDAAALGRVLAQATRGENGLLRMQASAWLPGYLIGPFRYEGTRGDDPNDVIPHEERRELRGARLLAAWVNHFDAREQNTMDSWLAAKPKERDSSPGFVRHYYLDTSDSFGSEWAQDGISRRLGNSYLLDFGDIGADFVTFGARHDAWESAQRTPGFHEFGYFNAREFDPENWKNEYPNPAFSRATEHDNAWMARILARFERDDIAALVSLGRFSRPAESAFLTDVLEHRLERILARYLTVLSPLADPTLDRDHLSFVDLARRRGVKAGTAFAYRARLVAGDRNLPLAAELVSGGGVRVTLPHRAFAAGLGDDAAERYLVVSIDDGVARYPLRAHLYDLGAERGFRLVGLERPTERFDDVVRKVAEF